MAIMAVTEHYQAAYPALSASLYEQAQWLQAWRNDGWQRFCAGGFPPARAEDWRYLNLAALYKQAYLPAAAVAVDAKPYFLVDAYRMVFVNGHFSAVLSNLADLPEGVSLQALSASDDAQLNLWQTHLGQAVSDEQHNLLAFCSAWFADGLLLQVAANVILDKPIQILHIAASEQVLAATRHIVVLETGASAQVVETFVGTAEQYFTAAVSEAFIGANAALSWTKAQLESQQAQHFGGIYVKQAQHSRFNQHNFALGGQLARTDVQADLLQAAECHLYGLLVGAGRQQLDNFTRINHLQPHGLSRQYYKGILDQRARGVFQGRVVVAEAAQKTDSQMQNRNLLLSADAEIDSKPQLEIYADDVKCSHGLTVGQLDEQSLFYLQSRGLDVETAQHVLTFAFANEMLGFIEQAPLRDWLYASLAARFPALAGEMV